ncbi:hypothetical protein SBC1_77270 (plasmid) [Caballeronia sp. SBC1]|nr:hypothetical protein SBC2_80450 [Caballeronia sp. SBC2]QIN67680.1 hypothetical protein SBC1_77270 [Caballeronia sp. SBC1]
MKLTRVGMDIAKNVIQLHYIDAETGEILNRSVKRRRFSSILRTGRRA